ncbi:lactam utilization protein B [Arthrobacter woluwensis]|nr:lactam utilization protein B [Arthrobacter woluwensis]
MKPHGALYNTIVRHEGQARAVVDAVLAVDPALPLLVLPGSAVERIAAEAGLRTVAEAFADRAYRPDGTLVPRSDPGAVLHDIDRILDHVFRLVDGTVRAVDGTVLPVAAGSICVHGDTPGAVAMAERIHRELTARGVVIQSFA